MAESDDLIKRFQEAFRYSGLSVKTAAKCAGMSRERMFSYVNGDGVPPEHLVLLFERKAREKKEVLLQLGFSG